MANQSAAKLRRIFGIALSVMLVISGICLIWGCCSIYFTGEGKFSRDIVAEAFSPIAIPVYLTLALTVAGWILDLFLPAEKQKKAVEVNHALILQRLHEKTDLSQCDIELAAAVKKEQKNRKCHKAVSILLLVLGTALFLPYGLNGSNYHQREITDSLVAALYLLIPCMAVPFGYGIFTAYFCRASIRREIQLLKQAGANRSPAPAAEAKCCKAGTYLRYGFLVLAIAILVYGYFAGGTADVLTKAINICTECVGLG